MPRYSRRLSQSGIYHVMVRGINKMPIFLDKYDYEKFIGTLVRMKAEGEYRLYAYCLMKNHVHLLIKEEGEPLSRTMKRIGVSYSYYFNKRYDRVGHLFQGRFRSENIETDDYLLSCIRYIHNNPVAAGLVPEPSQYPWSSYNIYIGRKKDEDDIVDREAILEMFSANKSKAIKQFIDFTASKSQDKFIDLEDKQEDSEEYQIQKVQAILKGYDLDLDCIADLKDRKTRREIIKAIDENVDISTRQLASIIGWSKDTIARALRE